MLLSGAASWQDLLEATSVITGDVPGINRCVWNIGVGVPNVAIPLTASVTRERLGLLREADHLVMEALRRHDLYHDVWQCPTVLVPLDLDGTGGELVVVRPIRSQRAMTAAPVELPATMLDELRESVLGLEGISGLALDLTSKPPGTIEWE